MTGPRTFRQALRAAAGAVWWALGAHAQNVTRADSEPTQLKPVVVEAQRLAATAERSYTVTNIHTAAWTDVPIDKTPVSAQVVPRQVIEDQACDRLKDVVRNVSGISQVKTEGRGIQFEEYNVRGFSQRAMLDGFTLYAMPVINLAGVEQVEVLKGPSSSLYGGIEPGGFVNVLPKLPSFQSRTTIYGEVGSHDHYRSGIDTQGTIDSNTAYRVIADYENSDSFRDHLSREAYFFSPSMTWVLPDQTRITWWLWYQHLERPVDNGIVFDKYGNPVGSISDNFASSKYTSQTIDDITTGLRLDHPVSDDFSVHLRYMYHYFDGQYDAIRLSKKTDTTISPRYDNSSFHNDEHDILDYAIWHFNVGPTEHRLLFGTEFSLSDYTYDQMMDSTLAPFSIYNPVYYSGPFHPTGGTVEQLTLTKVAAGYVQDQIDLLEDRLHLLVGGRADYVDRYNRSTSNSKYTVYDLGFSGRAGALYDLTDWMSPYVTVSRSFNPTTGTTYEGDIVDPTTGLQFEGGAKFKFFDKRLQLTTSAYQCTKDNVPIRDMEHYADGTYYVNGGRQRAEGFDVDVLGQITREWQVVGSYSYTDTRVVKVDKNSASTLGKPLLNVPLNSGSLWLKYTLQEGPLNGLGAGLGFFASEESSGDSAKSFELPGYTRWDSGVWYARRLAGGCQLKVQVNVLNVFNKSYYESSSSTASVEPGYPRCFVCRVSLTF